MKDFTFEVFRSKKKASKKYIEHFSKFTLEHQQI